MHATGRRKNSTEHQRPPHRIAVVQDLAFFAGHLPDIPTHRSIAHTLVAGIEGPISVRARGRKRWVKGRFLVLCGRSHLEVAFHDQAVAVAFIDPRSSANPSISQALLQASFLVDPVWSAPIREALIGARQSPDFRAAVQTLRATVKGTFSDLLPKAGVDERLTRISRRIASAPEDTSDVQDLSGAIGMSPSWLQHKFPHSGAGVSILEFRTWHRVKAATVSLSQGATLAEASTLAGFYDQAHFTNAFRRIFGLSPAKILQSGIPIDWLMTRSAG